MNIKEAHRLFLEYIEIEKGLNHKTISNYDFALNRFIRYSKIGHTDEITKEQVRSFRIHLNRRKIKRSGSPSPTLSKKSQNHHLIVLREFLRFLIKRDIPAIAPEQIELAKVPESTTNHLTPREINQLLTSLPKPSNNLKDIRDRAIIEVLYSSGMRLSELCSLKRNIDLTMDELSIRGKGGKVRVVFLSPSAKKALNKWELARRDFDKALFVGIGPKNKAAYRQGKSIALQSRSVQMTASIILVSDLLLIPIRPGAHDVRSMDDFFERYNQAKEFKEEIPAYFILNEYNDDWELYKGIRAVLKKKYDIPIFETTVKSRVAYGKGGVEGLSGYEKDDFRAKLEMVGLTKEVIDKAAKHGLLA